MARFQIHHQLLLDTHRLGRFQICHLLLHRNGIVPWFILVPETDVTDLLDLPADLRAPVIDESGRVSSFIKNNLDYPKVNFAAIGNIVPQLHLHVVGRKPDDPCWPAPVWGNLKETAEYSSARLREITEALIKSYSLEPAL